MMPPDSIFPESLLLLDGSALAYRAHFAMAKSGLSNGAGLPTGATFGVAMEMERLLKRIHPRYAALVMDTKEPTFRHLKYPDYKATRDRMPDELAEQLPWIKDVARALGVPVLELPGFEADDLMGTLAKEADRQSIPVLLVTGDKDFFQLVTDRVLIYNVLKRDQEVLVLDPVGVREHFGVAPDQVVDVLALMGDSSDNVPGVPGIGEKTAKRLIAQFGSLDALLAYQGPDLSPKLSETLKNNRDRAELCRELVTIDTNVPLGVPISDLRYEGPNVTVAAETFQRLDFRTLAASYASQVAAKDAPPKNYRVVRTEAELDACLERLRQAPLVAVDTETTGLNPRACHIVGFSFSCAPNEAWYVPLNQHPPVVPAPEDSPLGQGVVNKLKPFLESAEGKFCGQNVKYDMLLMRNHGIDLSLPRIDTLIAAYLLEPHERERNLDALTLRHFGHTKIKTESLIGKGKDQLTMDLLPIDDVGEYACEDADYTYRLADRFLPRLSQEGLLHLHDDIEVPLIRVLADMEAHGVRVDKDRLRAMAAQMQREVDALLLEIEAAAGRPFNVNSPKQLGELLFDELKIHEALGYKPRRTSTGWATGQEVLDALSGHPLPDLILKYRSRSKLLGTYIRPLPELVDPFTGRIHTSYNQTVAATGRLSSSDPNLQNIPIRTEAGKAIREAFLPSRDDHVLLSADYSQVELRIMAHMSKDQAMIDAFLRGEDIHRDTASRVFQVPLDQVDSLMRSRAKAINFGLMYGMGASRLAEETGMTPKESKEFIERYFGAFPAVREFVESLKEFTRQNGYALTLSGRKRPIPDIHSSNGMLRNAAENMAINTPIQGTAADILKIAMVSIHRRLKSEGLLGRMILTVHDEIVLDLPEAELAQVKSLVTECMESAMTLLVPLKVDMGIGKNWLLAHS
mgnify:CR=1 FL=1|jgi:DNA polymerase-1